MRQRTWPAFLHVLSVGCVGCHFYTCVLEPAARGVPVANRPSWCAPQRIAARG
jgi:hypothetical protein